MTHRYDRYLDSQLISLYKKYADEEAFEELLRRYNGLVEYFTKRVYIVGYDEDDVKQVCFMAFLSAVQSFDPDRGVSFGTFASTCLKNRAAQLIRDNLSKGRGSDEYVITSYDSSEYQIADTIAVYDDSHLTNHLIAEDAYAVLKRVLSKQEYSVFSMYALGYNYMEIAAKYKMTRKQVDNSICRARKKLCDYFERHGENYGGKGGKNK